MSIRQQDSLNRFTQTFIKFNNLTCNLHNQLTTYHCIIFP